LRKYDGLVLNVEEPFVFIEDLAIIVEKNIILRMARQSKVAELPYSKKK
jgi:hypothetical protein